MRGLYTMSSSCLYWDPQIMWSVRYCWRKVHRCFSLPFFFKFSRGQKASVFGRVTSVKIRVDLALKTKLCMSCTCMLSNNFPCTLLLEVLTIKLFNKPVSLQLNALIWFWSFAEQYCPYPASQLIFVAYGLLEFFRVLWPKETTQTLVFSSFSLNSWLRSQSSLCNHCCKWVARYNHQSETLC